MQSLTFIPHFVWVLIWFGCGVLALAFIVIRHSWLSKRQAVEIPDYSSGNSTDDVLERTRLLLKKIKQNKN